MASIISAGTTSGTALNMAGDTSGQLQLATNGSTTAVTIDTSQNVGIGTTSPNAKLEVSAGALGTTSGNSVEIARFNNTNSNSSILRFYQYRNANGSAWTTSSTRIQQRVDTTDQSYIEFNPPSGNYALAFGTGPDPVAERMRIDSSGNVGIGTSSPNDRLHISSSGDTTLRQTKTGQSDWAFQTLDSGAWRLYSYTASAVRMYVNSSGNVGIGTDSPSYKLESFNTTSGSAIAASVNDGAGSSAFGYGMLVKNQGHEIAQMLGSYVTSAGGGSGYLYFTTRNGGTLAERMRISETGSLILVGSTAQKATGTTWSNPSDQRLKENIRDYTKGTAELMQVRVREWEYNGKGNTTEGMKGLGVVADEVMTVLPNTVETYDAKLNADDEETTEIKKFDATEITWLLVKTVQEQQQIITDLKATVDSQFITINDLKARVTALEGAA